MGVLRNCVVGALPYTLCDTIIPLMLPPAQIMYIRPPAMVTTNKKGKEKKGGVWTVYQCPSIWSFYFYFS